MKIVILRHGKPKIGARGRLSASGFGQWVAAYNKAGIDNAHDPTPNAITQAQACTVVVCSNLPRSIESATVLGVKNVIVQDSLFRECDMPYADWNYPKLSMLSWSFIFRILQLFGYSPNAESFKEAKQRAHGCALRLGKLAQQYECVLLVGHGSLNWLISKKLLRMGWVGPRNPGRNYWEYGVYRYNATYVGSTLKFQGPNYHPTRYS